MKYADQNTLIKVISAFRRCFERLKRSIKFFQRSLKIQNKVQTRFTTIIKIHQNIALSTLSVIR